MTDFVLERSEKSISHLKIIEVFKEGARITNEIFNYANFLNQPLELWMFVPCDESGEVLEESGMFKLLGEVDNDLEQQKYQQAKDKVLFYGFYIAEIRSKKEICIKLNTISEIDSYYQYSTIPLDKKIEFLTHAGIYITDYAIKLYDLNNNQNE
jgi:hypothetical protein